MPLLNFTFEELPLVIDDGYEAGLINGAAELTYLTDGSWCIHNISLDGHRPATYTEEEKLIARIKGRILPRYRSTDLVLARTNPLFSLITQRLEGKWASRVQDAVREQIYRDHEAQIDSLTRQRERA